MTNEERITSTALCQYRFYLVKKFREKLAAAKAYRAAEEMEMNCISMHKAMLAAKEAFEVHDMLKCGVELVSIYDDVWDLWIIKSVLDRITPAAEEIYAAAEAAMEDAALTKFHHDAYGDD